MNQEDFEKKLHEVADFTYTGQEKNIIAVSGFKKEAKPCEDCENLVEDRMVEIKLSKSGLRRRFCDNCRKYASYETGEFCINTGKDWTNHWHKHERPLLKKPED